MAIYLGILLPIRRISNAMHQKIYNPIKVICRIKEFTRTIITKNTIIFDDSLTKEGSHFTNYHRLISDLKTNENGKKCYQDSSWKTV